MGTRSLHSDNPVQSRRKRSFTLPSFRKSSGRDRPVQTNAEEMARVRKAAAWQWYTRGLGEVVAPTKAARPAAIAPAGNSPVDDKCGVDGSDELMNKGSNKQKQQILKAALPDQPLQRAASRFKTEATARPTASAHGAAPSPLYDEFELSGLRTHMASFVQRLQQKQQKAHEEESLQAAAYGHQKSNKAQAPAGISTAAAGAIPAAASTNAFHRPLTALHRFFRKVISGSALKNTQNSPTMITTPSPAVLPDPFVLLDEEEDAQCHYHHYIHHHHHHYHYGHSPEEGAAITRRRRHSESSGMGPWEELVEEDLYGGGGEEESAIQAFLARRRRYSDSFAGHKAVTDAEDQERGPMQPGTLQFQRRYNSERFMSSSPNKIPMVDGGVSKLGSKDEIDGERMQNTDTRSRRRHSAEIVTEGATFSKKSGEGCRATRGGKTTVGTYKLGGAHEGSAAPPMTEVPRRRHSETLRMTEVPRRRHSETLEASYRREMNDHVGIRSGDRASSPKVPMTPLWYVPASGRNLEEFRIPASANAARPRSRSTLPPIYPQ